MEETGETEQEKSVEPKYKPRPRTLVFCGNSRMPENVTAKHVFGYLSLELEVDPSDFKIVDVSCTLVPTLGEKILMNALMGYPVEEGIKNAVDEVENRFFSTTKRAIIAAIEDVHKRYTEYMKNI